MLTRYHDTFRSPTLDLFDSFGLFSDLTSSRTRSDTIDDEGIKIEMPGVRSNDLDVSVEGRTLKIAGKSRHGKEYSYTYSLRNVVDESLIEAKLQDGLLEIKLPKKLESKARKITVT
jgi:HSP20 family molecular chaperone IbpA